MTDKANIADLLAGRDWFKLQTDAETRAAVLHVYGTIGSSEWWDDVASPSLVRELDQLDADTITVYVNSPGGIADDGIAIMNALARNKAKVTAHIDGLAASAATIVMLGADEIVMGAGSRLMIHDAWSITWGQASEITKTAERLDKLSQTLAGLYAQRAGGDADEWRAAMVEETWYTAEEAVEAGLADRVAPLAISDEDDAPRNVIPIADAARAFGWRHPGREAAHAPFIPARSDATSVAPELPSSSEPGDTRETEKLTMSNTFLASVSERLGITDADASEETVMAALDEALAEQADTPVLNAVPEGAVVMDAAQHEQLVNDAAAGREAREQQISDRRDAIVNAAVSDGRIAPASRDSWRAQLDKDEEGISNLLGTFAKSSALPVAELGRSDSVTDADEALYGSVYPTEKEA